MVRQTISMLCYNSNSNTPSTLCLLHTNTSTFSHFKTVFIYIERTRFIANRCILIFQIASVFFSLSQFRKVVTCKEFGKCMELETFFLRPLHTQIHSFCVRESIRERKSGNEGKKLSNHKL